jgi:DNA-binding NarL/FixJ family response regulator
VTSVVLADDQELIRVGLRVMLEAGGIDVVAEAGDGRGAVQACRRHRPDVVLMDIRMPVLDGIAATAEIAAAGLGTRVLVLTTYDIDDLVYRALRAGADGFLLKSTPANRLVEAVRLVADGEALLSPSLTRRLIEQHVARPAPDGTNRALAGLTARERKVLHLIGRGRSNSEIAAELYVSETTVKTHVNRVFAKLRLQNRVQAVVLAYECGLVVPGRSPSGRAPGPGTSPAPGPGR